MMGSTMDARAYIALGGNVGDRHRTLDSALRAFASGKIAHTRLLTCSRIYETRAVGPSHAPFLNAVVELATGLAPSALMDALLQLERTHGRVRTGRWAARTLDLDLLVYARNPVGDPCTWTLDESCSPSLTLPHPGLTSRDFVLAPLCDVAPRLLIRGSTPAALLAQIPAPDRTILHAGPAPWP